MSGERLQRLEHAVTDLETRLEACEMEGARDRLALEELIERLRARRTRDRLALEELAARVEHLERDLMSDGWVRLLEGNYYRLVNWLERYSRAGDLEGLGERLLEARREFYREALENGGQS